ncbi:galectin-1-like isoform X1 [Antechinus flavipes]|uniref:galectin-1-like isoform X1 n=1 Tax=Antechinus flavipes TaxID=38775 RepID=UPI00223674FD|nr:galectin-1-like isoform X1 [Antechinus flavipes]
MAREIVAYKMSLRHGNCIKIVGDIPRDAKHCMINLGKDEFNIGLHFNPRFNYQNSIKKIICNSRNDGMWGKELQEHNFPFVLGTTMEISIIFEAHGFKVKLPDGFEFTFPNRLKLHTLNYLEIGHDILIRSVTFK